MPRDTNLSNNSLNSHFATKLDVEMAAVYFIATSLLVSATLVAATPCTTHAATTASLPSMPITSVARCTLAATSDQGLEMTIAITNLHGTQLSLSFGLNAGFPTPLGDPQPTLLPDSSSTQYLYPTGWAGRVAVGPNSNIHGSKIEGSFIIPPNGTVALPDIDVSYVDGYTVPITCSSEGITVTGCNIDLFKESNTCESQVDGPVCLNPAVSLPNGPPPDFFAPCAGAAYTYPSDDLANAYNKTSNSISCCIGTSCDAPLRQLQNYRRF